MTYAKLRDVGTTGPYAPNIKRSSIMLSNGRSAVCFVDTNRPGSDGEDLSNVAKIQVYVSEVDHASGTWTKAIDYAPAIAPASMTKQFIGSFAQSNTDSLRCAYVGSDNSLRFITWGTYNGSTGWAAPTEQIIVAGNATTNRFRAVDLTLAGTGGNGNPAVIVYEANASTGIGAYLRVYVRLNDNLTWIKAYERAVVAPTLFIKAGGEDVSISYEAGDITGNVGRLALYCTQTATTVDSGDWVGEITFDVAAGTTNSATLVGTWFPTGLNRSMASGQRRGWLFSDLVGRWVLGTAIGTSAPFFEGIKLQHNVFTGIARNRIGNPPTAYSTLKSFWLSKRLPIYRDANAWASVTASYSDNRLIFVYSGLGDTSNRAARAVMMRWSSATSQTPVHIDTTARMLDNGYAGPAVPAGSTERGGVIGVYGGNNKNNASAFNDYDFAVLYGDMSNSVSGVADDFTRTLAAGSWGITDYSGHTWVPNTPSSFSVNGARGVIAETAVAISRRAYISGFSATDVDITSNVQVQAIATGAPANFGVMARFIDANNYYYGYLLLNADQSVQLSVSKNVAGVFTALASIPTGVNYSINTRQWVRLQIIGSTLRAMFWQGASAPPIDWAVTTTDSSLTSGSVGIRAYLSTGNTNTLPYNFDVDTFSATPLSGIIRSRELRAAWEDVLSAPLILSPSLTSVVPTNRPLLRVTFQNAQTYSNSFGKVQWQLARDSGFTTDLRTIEDVSANYESVSTTSGVTAPLRTISYQMKTSDSPLYTGTWYIRARMLDDLGSAGAWSSTQTFNVSHPPVTMPKSPGAGKTLKYGVGDVTFDWQFTDPESSNTQSAYQVLVERQDTGELVHDTGKVTSSASSIVVNLVVGVKDAPLQWRVRAWDNDDAVGAYSDPLSFVVADPPTVTLTSPTQGAVVTTALPTFQWSFSAGGVRTQRGYRITVYDATVEPAAVAAESGWQFGADTSYTFPTQILQNNKTYVVILQVQDNVGMFSEVNREVDFKQQVINSGFESGVANWSASGGGAQAQSNLYAKRGSYSLEITADGVGASPHSDSNIWDVTPGEQVRAWGWIYDPVAVFQVGVRLNWYDASGIYLSTSVFSLAVIPAGVWTFVDNTATAPAGAYKVSATASIVGTPSAGYKVYFDEIKASGAVGSLMTFDSDWIEPAVVVPTLTFDAFKITVAWDNTLQDLDFVSWRLYRKYMKPIQSDFDVDNTANTWELIYETMDQGASLQYNDYVAPLGKAVDYVVVQLVDRFGSLIESDITAWSTVTQQGNRYFFVPEVPVGAIASFEAGSVVSDSFSDEVEQETLHVIGRGRQVQVGDDLGYSGSLGIHLWNPATARRDREFLELLASSKTGNVYLKTPFGDVLYVRLGPISVNRLSGRGADDITDITVPYLVVFSEVPPVTRTA